MLRSVSVHSLSWFSRHFSTSSPRIERSRDPHLAHGEQQYARSPCLVAAARWLLVAFVARLSALVSCPSNAHRAFSCSGECRDDGTPTRRLLHQWQFGLAGGLSGSSCELLRSRVLSRWREITWMVADENRPSLSGSRRWGFMHLSAGLSWKQVLMAICSM